MYINKTHGIVGVVPQLLTISTQTSINIYYFVLVIICTYYIIIRRFGRAIAAVDGDDH